MPRTNTSRLWFLLTTIAIDSIGLGIIIPVLPDVIRRFITDEAAVSRMYGYFIATYALMQFISSPLLGSLSDRVGRRPVLLLSLLGAAIDYFFMAFAGTLPLLFLGRVIAGVSGASYTVASAYVADISDDSNRSKNFGVVGAGFGIGFIAGPAIGGVLAQFGPQYPFIAAGCFNLANCLFGFFVLPESLPHEARESARRTTFNLNPFQSLAKILRIPFIRPLIVVAVLMSLAGQTHPSIWTLYTQHRYGWSVQQVGISLAVVGLLQALSQGLLTGVIVKRFGERKVFLFGLFGEIVSYCGFAFAPNVFTLYFTLLFSSIFWAAQPALQSLISREVSSQEQGELQGTLMGLGSLMAILNPLIVTALFAATSNPAGHLYLPGSPYLFASLLFAIAMAISLPWSARSQKLRH